MKRRESSGDWGPRVTDRNRHTGRDDRATTENVMDPRTRFILYQMLNRGLLTEINGCVSTGKEVTVTTSYSLLGQRVSCAWRRGN